MARAELMPPDDQLDLCGEITALALHGGIDPAALCGTVSATPLGQVLHCFDGLRVGVSAAADEEVGESCSVCLNRRSQPSAQQSSPVSSLLGPSREKSQTPPAWRRGLYDIVELDVLLRICGFLQANDLCRLACVSRGFSDRAEWPSADGADPELLSLVEESARSWVQAMGGDLRQPTCSARYVSETGATASTGANSVAVVGGAPWDSEAGDGQNWLQRMHFFYGNSTVSFKEFDDYLSGFSIYDDPCNVVSGDGA